MDEMWTSVLGFENLYEVSSLGRVRSVERVVSFGNATRRVAPRVLAALDNGSGYKQVHLSDGSRRQRMYVHQLVATAFCRKMNDGHVEVNHLDLDKSNNAASNLEWISRSGNVRHAMACGVSFARYGDDNFMTKVPDAVVDAMLRKQYWQWGEKSGMARRLGVSSVTVTNIANRKARMIAAGGIARSRGGWATSSTPMLVHRGAYPCVSGVKNQTCLEGGQA